MSTVRAFIRTKAKSRDFTTYVRFRLYDGRNKQLFYKSEIVVKPEVWDQAKECIKAKILYDPHERAKFNIAISTRKSLLLDVYESCEDKKALTSAEFVKLIDMRLHPEKYVKDEGTLKDFFYWFERFLQVKNYSPTDVKNYHTMMRMLRRFELFQKVKANNNYKLDFGSMNVDTIRDLEKYVREEYKYVDKEVFKFIFDEIPEKRKPDVRGSNTIAKIMKRFRTFIKWCMKEGVLLNDPFIGYEQKNPDRKSVV